MILMGQFDLKKIMTIVIWFYVDGRNHVNINNFKKCVSC